MTTYSAYGMSFSNFFTFFKEAKTIIARRVEYSTEHIYANYITTINMVINKYTPVWLLLLDVLNVMIIFNLY